MERYKVIQPNGINLATLSIRLRPGDVVGFDGSNLLYKGKTHVYPDFNGAKRVGWAEITTLPLTTDANPNNSADPSRVDNTRSSRIRTITEEDKPVARVRSAPPEKAPEAPTHRRMAVVNREEETRSVKTLSSPVPKKAEDGARLKVSNGRNDHEAVVGRARVASADTSFVVEDSSTAAQLKRQIEPDVVRGKRVVIDSDALAKARTMAGPLAPPKGEVSKGEVNVLVPSARLPQKDRVVAGGRPAAIEVDSDADLSRVLEEEDAGPRAAASEEGGDEADPADPVFSPIVVPAGYPRKPSSVDEAIQLGTSTWVLVPPSEGKEAITWDQALPWRTRVRAALAYKSHPSVMDAIMGLEANAVTKEIQRLLPLGKTSPRS